MVQIVVEQEIAEQIRRSEGRIELVDDQGRSVGIVRRLPSREDIDHAVVRAGRGGPKYSVDQLIEKIEKL